MSKQKIAAGSGHSTTAKNKSSDSIIAKPIDVVNMVDPEIIKAATARLRKEDKRAKYDRHGQVMHGAILAALVDFCEQNAEFARAVCQSDKTMQDCLKSVAKNVGSAISDIDAYTRAVQFYFPGAVIKFHMTIHMSQYEDEDLVPVNKTIPLSLDSLLDW